MHNSVNDKDRNNYYWECFLDFIDEVKSWFKPKYELAELKPPIEDWEKTLNEYLKSEEHLFDCCGYSEGLECCLEKKWIRNFIRRLLKDTKS